MEYTVDNEVPLPSKDWITVHVCQRGKSLPASSNVIVRKFKSADCGNTLEVHITRKSGYIKKIVPLYACSAKCVSCENQIAKIRALIAAEHEKDG